MKRFTIKSSKLINKEKNTFVTIMYEVEAETWKIALEIARLNGDELFGFDEYAIEVFEIINYPNGAVEYGREIAKAMEDCPKHKRGK